jgi:type II secretory pathway component PulF
MTEAARPLSSFAYRAQMPDGQGISGTIDAADRADADRRLAVLQLRILELQPTTAPSRFKPFGGRLRSDDFLAFNQQLAQLSGAGMPVEPGLRLIAQEIRGGKLRRAIDRVTADLETGKTLTQAIDANRANFPPLYSRLVDAGIRSGNLSAVLLNLGRHITLMRRLQTALWRALAYPAIVLGAFVFIFFFVMTHVVPLCRIELYRGMQVPALTQAALDVSDFLSAIPFWPALGLVAVLGLLVFLTAWMLGKDRSISEPLLLPLPLLGPIWRRNLLARWCDAVALGVDAGMDLPAAIALADDAIASPALKSDGQAIIAAISNGKPISSAGDGKILTPMLLSAMELGATRGELSTTLHTLSISFQQQSETRVAGLQAILTPIVLLFLGALICLLLVAMFSPLMAMLSPMF